MDYLLKYAEKACRPVKHGGVSSECVIHSVKASVKNCLYLEGLGRCIDVRTSYAHARGWANSRNIATNYISGEVSPSASVAIRAYREVNVSAV